MKRQLPNMGLVRRFDVGFGVEPGRDDHLDLLSDTGWLEDRTHNLYRSVDGYHRLFDAGSGARHLAQPSSDPDREWSSQAALERIHDWARTTREAS